MFKFLLIIAILTQTLAFSQAEDMALVKGGIYTPLYGNNGPVTVDGFLMDIYPVTNAEFLKFVNENPRWRRSRVKELFADDNYLQTWKSDTLLGKNHLPNAPVTNVSWFAAKNYCECQGKRLPSVNEWEYAAMANKTRANARRLTSFNQFILNWYETSNTYNNEIGKTFKNYWGVYDLHGLVWEWTANFNSVMLTGESRKGGTKDNNLFCGAASIGANDLMNYAAFMRYAFRGSLEANYSIKNLGFRCVKDMQYELVLK